METESVVTQRAPARQYRVVVARSRVVAVLIPNGLSDLQHCVAASHLGDRHLTAPGEASVLAKRWGVAEVIGQKWWVDSMLALDSTGSPVPKPTGLDLRFA